MATDEENLAKRKFEDLEDAYGMQIRKCVNRFRLENKEARGSQYHQLLNAIEDAARTYAIENKPRLESLVEDVRSAANAASLLAGAFEFSSSVISNPSGSRSFWHHRPSLLQEVISSEPPNFSRADVEGAATWYVNQRICVPALELLLIEMLTAMEVSAVAAEMYQPEKYSRTGSMWSPIKQMNPIWWFAIGLGAEFILGGLLIALLIWLSRWIGDTIPLIVGSLIVLGYLILFGIGLFKLPGRLSAHYRIRRLAHNRLDTMYAAYLNIPANGPVSAQNIRRMLDKASDAGAVWPPSLFVILDRMQGRFEKDTGLN